MGNCIKRLGLKEPQGPEEPEKNIVIVKHKTHFPHHEPRKNSTIYNRTHRALRNVPCFICGTTPIETHHFYIEKAAENAIDWKVFGKFADQCYNIQSGESLAKFDWSEVAQNPDLFVDSPQNMITLCLKHHRSSCGIHHVPFPDWILQKFPKDGFQFITEGPITEGPITEGTETSQALVQT